LRQGKLVLGQLLMKISYDPLLLFAAELPQKLSLSLKLTSPLEFSYAIAKAGDPMEWEEKEAISYNNNLSEGVSKEQQPTPATK